MKMTLRTIFFLFVCLFIRSALGDTATTVEKKIAYFSLKPEIVTNYITKGKKLGFINLKVDLIVNDKSLLEIVEYHQPLITDAIIRVLNKEDEIKIKSMAGREAIRQASLQKINQILLEEVEADEDIVADLLFTKYLYQ